MNDQALDNLFDCWPVPDCWSEPFWKVEGVDKDDRGRTSFGLPEGASKADAFARMAELQQEHPEYVTWAVLKFEKWIHITREKP